MDCDQTNYNILNIDLDILTKAWDGDAAAQLKLGKACFSAVHIKNNCLDAFKWLFRSAEQGNMEAQFILGDLYALGHGTQKNLTDAYRWYTKAALQGYKKALIRIHNLYQDDKKMYCRGQLNSDEEEWASDEFKKKNNIRELNEYRREQQALKLNSAINYYTGQVKNYKSLNQEDVEVQIFLAFFYQYGYGTRKNILLAIDFYTNAAEKGHKDAQYNLGCLYQYNARIQFNYRLALRWYRVSATNGNVTAQNCLGYFYEKGLATNLSYEGAIYWYTRAANSGCSGAQLTLGRFYRNGQGVEQDLIEATKWYKLAANQKSIPAQSCLNQMYLERISPKITNTSTLLEHIIEAPTIFTLRNKLQIDITKLHNSPQFKQLKKLAKHAFRTDGNAMFKIGLKYYNGEGLPQDKDAGFRWIKKAGKAGLQEAELKISNMYEEGNTADQDYHQSVIWIKKAVNKRNVNAQYRLDLLYKKDAKKRHANIQYKLGLLYKKGLGVRKDSVEASIWFLKSAAQENNDAEYQFGLLKYYGEGLLQDDEIARKWFQLAIFHGNVDALYKVAKAIEKKKSRYKILETRDSKFDIPISIPAKKTHTIVITWKTSKSQAFLMYNLAAHFENKDAQFRLGEIYEEGKQVEQDRHKSYKYYIKAASSGDPFYQTELAIKYLNGDFNNANYRKAFDLLKKAADKKEPRAAGIFETPMKWIDEIKDLFSIINIFISASFDGIKGIDYNLGHVYEHGITINDKKVFINDFAESKLWYSRAADKGNSKAQYRLGVIYEEGKGVKVDFISAVKYYKQAYKNGNRDAAYKLGLMYLNGNGVPRDLIESFILFSEASNMGHKKAYEKLKPSNKKNIIEMLEAAASLGYVAIQYQLGVFYENVNDPKSFEWFTLAIQGRISDAYYRLGVLYEEGRGTPRNYPEAISFYEQAISNDYEDAMYRLGHICHYGLGTKCDLQKAFYLYTSAAEIGHRLSQKILNISREHRKKTGEELSISGFKHEDTNNLLVSNSLVFEYSLKMYKYVAEQGNIQAQYTIGLAYENIFKKPNYPEAVKWYTMATENLHGTSMYRLGLFYEKGLGVAKNYQKSVQLYKDAYTQRNYDALYRLAKAYYHGFGVDIDRKKAIQYYTEAAKHGQHDAQYNLGVLHDRGELVQKNILEALKWYTISYSQGNDSARQILFSMYVDLPLENYFHQQLYSMINSALKYNNAYNYQADNETYGHLYYRLGYFYLNGIGTERDYKRAWEYITESVRTYKYKDVLRLLELDSMEKVEIETKAADDGNEYARYSVGKYHFLQATQERIKQQIKNYTTNINEKTEPNDDITKDHYKKAIKYFSLSALDRNRDSQFYLGKIYQKGYGTDIDYEQAKQWYIMSSQRKHKGSLHNLSMLYLKEKDYPETRLNLDRAVQEGNEDSLFQLGWMYEHGIGDIHRDKGEAKNYFEKASKYMQSTSEMNDNNEDSSSEHDITVDEAYYQNLYSEYISKQDGISLADLHMFSDNGIGEASYTLSQKYFDGTDVERHLSHSLSYLRKAALQDDAVSQEKIALSYYYGDIVVKDLRIATIWFRMAVEKKKNKLSMLHLGQIYQCGLVDKPNFPGAFKLYKAINEIYRDVALQGIGLLYEYGDGFKTNQALALRYYIESFKEGNNFSGYNIALMYFYGRGVNQDYLESIYWLEKALQEPTMKDLPYVFIKSENNLVTTIENQPNGRYSIIRYKTFVAEINYLLGRIYYEGRGVQEDRNRSFEYFLNAADNGKTEAEVQLAEIKEERRQLEEKENNKKAYIEAKSQLKKTTENSKIKLKKTEDAKIQIGKFETMALWFSNMKEMKSLPIEEMKSQLEQEIKDAELLLEQRKEDKKTTKELKDANSRLEKIIDDVQPHLKVIEEAESKLFKINEAKKELKETIKKAEVLLKKIEEAILQFGRFQEYKSQFGRNARNLGGKISQLKIKTKSSKDILKRTEEVEKVLQDIKLAKSQLSYTIDNNDETLKKIEEAKLEFEESEQQN